MNDYLQYVQKGSEILLIQMFEIILEKTDL